MHAVKFTNNSSDAITPCLVTDLLCIALKDKSSLQYEPGLFIAFSMTLMLEGQLDQQGFFFIIKWLKRVCLAPSSVGFKYLVTDLTKFVAIQTGL